MVLQVQLTSHLQMVVQYQCPHRSKKSHVQMHKLQSFFLLYGLQVAVQICLP